MRHGKVLHTLQKNVFYAFDLFLQDPLFHSLRSTRYILCTFSFSSNLKSILLILEKIPFRFYVAFPRKLFFDVIFPFLFIHMSLFSLDNVI